MSTLVIKFGGNVLGSESGIHDALKVIASQRPIWDNLIVVTSALSGVTDALHDIVQTAEGGDQNAVRTEIAHLRALHTDAARYALGNTQQQEALLRELDNLFFDLLDDYEIIRQKRQAQPALADRVAAMGERLITRIVAAAARAQNQKCVALDATSIIVTDDRHSNARPIFNLSKHNIEQNLMPLLVHKIIPVVTGYIGATQQGAITTLGRGGSDYSATYLGALLSADEIWLFTDVDGLMSADPAVVKEARVLSTSSYAEVAEMAYFGARVLHPRAVEPLIQYNIPLRIRSIAHTDTPGTYICDYTPPRDHRIHAVTEVDAVMIAGPSQSNIAEACNRLLSQYLLDEIQPTLQVEAHSNSLLVYIAPTNANRAAFNNCIYQIKTYESGDEWQVTEVVVIAVIGNLQLEDYVNVLRSLTSIEITPLAFGQGPDNVLLIAVTQEQSQTALTRIHSLIVR